MVVGKSSSERGKWITDGGKSSSYKGNWIINMEKG